MQAYLQQILPQLLQQVIHLLSSARPFLMPASMGFIGGVARATVGLLKAITKNKKMNWAYWTVTVGASGVIGVFTGMLFSNDFRMSLLAGYAGTDFIEGMYKAFKVHIPSVWSTKAINIK